jgi:hypothetical protein
VHVFTPDHVKGAARLTCPRCGSVFDFRAKGVNSTAAKSQATAKPPAPPGPIGEAPPIPVAVPVASTIPVAMPVLQVATPPATQGNDPTFADLGSFAQIGANGATSYRRRPARRGIRRWAVIGGIVVVALALLTAGIAIAAGRWMGFSLPRIGGVVSESSWEWPQGNCAYRSPGEAWKQDKALQVKLKAYHAMRREGPDTNLALAFRDYKTRSPSEAELREQVLAHLRSLLPEALETEMKDGEGALLRGQPAWVLAFAGQDEHHVPMTGECYMSAHQGYGYWFFTWGPELERATIEQEWRRAREGFSLGTNRNGWQETSRETYTVHESAAAKVSYTLKPVKGLWKKEALDNAAARALYANADMVLIGTYPGEPKSQVKAGTSATAQVVILDDKKGLELPGAITAAGDFLLERQKDKRDGGDYTYPNTKIDFVQDKSIRSVDDPIGSGTAAGRVQKLLVENDRDRYRYVVLRITNHHQGLVVLWMECDNRYRDYWEPEFVALLETLQF